MIKQLKKVRISMFTMVMLFVVSTTVFSMEIKVKVSDEDPITLNVDAQDTISSVKEKIMDKEGIPEVVQKIMFGMEELKDIRTLSDYNIQKNDMLTVTINGTLPRIEVHEVAGITATSGISSVNITDIGMPNPTAYGICWSTEENPTIADAHTNEGGASETGMITIDITGLIPNIEYYSRAYVTNAIGTNYSEQLSFTTLREVDPYEGVTIIIDGTKEIDIIEQIETFTVTAKLMKDGEEIVILGTEYVWSVSEEVINLTANELDSSMCEVKLKYDDFSYGGYGTSYKVSVKDHLEIESRVSIEVTKDRPYSIDGIRGIGVERKAADYEVVLPLITVYDVNDVVVDKPLLVTCDALGEDFTYNGDGTVTLSKDVALGTYSVTIKILGNEDIYTEFDLSISEEVTYGEVTDIQININSISEVNVSFEYDGDVTGLLDLKAQVFPVGYPALALGRYMNVSDQVLEDDMKIFPQLIGAKGGEIVPYSLEVVMRGKDGTHKVWTQAFEFIVPDITFEIEEDYKIEDGCLEFTAKSVKNHSGTEFVNTSEDEEMAEFMLIDLTEVRRQYEAYGLTLNDLMKSRQVVMGMGGLSTNGKMMYKKRHTILKEQDYYMFMFCGNDDSEFETMVSISKLFQADIPTVNPSGGEFVGSTEVALTSATTGASIYYTLDGSEPTIDSELYTEPITVSKTVTLKAMAFGVMDSDVMTALFTKKSNASSSDSGSKSSIKPVDTNTVKGEAGDQTFNVGTKKTSDDGNGKVETIVTVEEKAIKIEVERIVAGSKISIPVTGSTDVAKGMFSVQTIKDMQSKNILLVVKTDQAAYELPTSEIDIKAISDRIGEDIALEDIAFAVEISKTSTDMVKIVENSTEKGGLSIVVPPVNFEIEASYKNTTYKVDKFKAFVTRTIEIPGNVDATKITTAIITDKDGSIRHIPTFITKINGKYYATINSLTNSTYTLINNSVTFTDVTDNHWAKVDIEKMANRLVVDGKDDGIFSPDESMTRAELSKIIVKALGIKPVEVEQFNDVDKGTQYADYIGTAYSYEIIQGISKTMFNPNGYITRQEVMTMIYRASTIVGIVDEGYISDISSFEDYQYVSDYAKEAVIWNIKQGIIRGKTGKTLAPLDNITRAEVSAVINRFLVSVNLIE